MYVYEMSVDIQIMYLVNIRGLWDIIAIYICLSQILDHCSVSYPNIIYNEIYHFTI
jgi:hypothetical protein